MTITSSSPVQLPRSATSNLINVLGLIAFAFAIFYCKAQELGGVNATLLCVGAYGITVLLLEVIFLRTPLRPSTGLDFSKCSWEADRIFYKLVGLYGCYGFIGLIYWGMPVYNDGFYRDYKYTVHLLLPYILVAAVPYIALVDCFMKQPQDNYYWFGRWLCLRGRGTSWLALRQLLLGWVVKGYFLPLMFVYMIGDVNYLTKLDVTEDNLTFLGMYHPIVAVVFVMDLLAAVAGYMMTFRLFDTHIRSAEPTFFGWFVCLACYDPFNSTYLSLYASYRGNDDRWIEWLQNSPDLLMVWGTVVFCAIFVYSAAGLNFGLRFSNITHRGVLTKGMFRFTKHPEYISKNFFWWMTFVPFVTLEGDDGSGWVELFRYCLLMGGVNLVYFHRARSEERHLSRDPVYVEYALWMNDHGSLAWLGRLIPYFKYKAPENWRELPYPYMGIK